MYEEELIEVRIETSLTKTFRSIHHGLSVTANTRWNSIALVSDSDQNRGTVTVNTQLLSYSSEINGVDALRKLLELAEEWLNGQQQAQEKS